MARMRDLISHHYYDELDPQIVRTIIGAPVERLRAACEAILAEPDAAVEHKRSVVFTACHRLVCGDAEGRGTQ